jgi:hypothetical protein
LVFDLPFGFDCVVGSGHTSSDAPVQAMFGQRQHKGGMAAMATESYRGEFNTQF